MDVKVGNVVWYEVHTDEGSLCSKKEKTLEYQTRDGKFVTRENISEKELVEFLATVQ